MEGEESRDESSVCGICQCHEVEEELECGHKACKACLEQWFSLQWRDSKPLSCPYCRRANNEFERYLSEEARSAPRRSRSESPYSVDSLEFQEVWATLAISDETPIHASMGNTEATTSILPRPRQRLSLCSNCPRRIRNPVMLTCGHPTCTACLIKRFIVTRVNGQTLECNVCLATITTNIIRWATTLRECLHCGRGNPTRLACRHPVCNGCIQAQLSEDLNCKVCRRFIGLRAVGIIYMAIRARERRNHSRNHPNSSAVTLSTL